MKKNPRFAAIVCFLLVFLPACTQAQNFVLKHYDANSGLASNRTYQIVQDGPGFIWVSTESGVSRFNGRQFTNYSKAKDNLSENEVLSLFPFGKDQIWFTGFSSPPGYYDFGAQEIRHSGNDSLLADLAKTWNSQDLVRCYLDDGEGGLWLASGNRLTWFGKKRCKRILSLDHASSFVYLEQTKRGLEVWNNELEIFQLKGDALELKNRLPFGAGVIKIIGWEKGKLVLMKSGEIQVLEKQADTAYRILRKINYPRAESIFEGKGRFSGYWVFVQCNGLFWYRSLEDLAAHRHFYHFLPGVCGRFMLIDRDENLWIATKEDGIYSLFNTDFRIHSNSTQSVNLVANAITGDGRGRVWAGFSNGSLAAIRKDGGLQMLVNSDIESGRVTDLHFSEAGLWMATDAPLFRIGGRSGGKEQVKLTEMLAQKSILAEPDGNLWIGTCCGFFRMKRNEQQQVIKIDSFRTTVVTTDGNGGIVVSGMRDLYRLIKEPLPRLVKMPYQIPMGNHISCMQAIAPGLLAIGTLGDGLHLVMNDTLALRIGEENNGLMQQITSNNCKALFSVRPGLFWLATDKGLNKISFSTYPSIKYTVSTYTRSNGLPDDNINDLFVQGDSVWLAGMKGAGLLMDTAYTRLSKPMTYILEARELVRGKLELNAAMEHGANNLVFRFTSICLQGMDLMEYQVKLEGLDREWQSAAGETVQYLGLPPGEYEFKARARYRFGEWGPASAPFRFTILPAWWQRWWFWPAVAVVALIGIYLLFRLQHDRAREHTEISRRMAELKLEAVRAQMNPHFIYNCLNSIQFYLTENDSHSAQKYLAAFGRLVRQTLDYSKRNTIRLDEEISFLTTYLSLEKMRLEDRLNYSVNAEGIGQTERWELPPLLIQPYVENAIRHGIRPMTTGGRVEVVFSLNAGVLYCRVEDNGQGRKAAESRSNEGVHGMSINLDRIGNLNLLRKGSIRIAITDKEVRTDGETGLRVVVSIPAE